MTETHKPLPVAGYVGQSDEKIALVNRNKEIEEETLRILDNLANRADVDKRHLALARTNIEQGFMWLNRSIFQPQRIKLPGDEAHP
jgi:hypothetical protein